MDSFVTPASWDQVVVGDDCLGMASDHQWEYGRVSYLSASLADRWAKVAPLGDFPFVVAELHQIRVPRHRVEREARPDRIDQAARILELEALLAKVAEHLPYHEPGHPDWTPLSALGREVRATLRGETTDAPE